MQIFFFNLFFLISQIKLLEYVELFQIPDRHQRKVKETHSHHQQHLPSFSWEAYVAGPRPQERKHVQTVKGG